MAEILEDFEFGSYRRGGREIYDWKNWFNGKVWALTPDVDFKGKAEDFRTTVYSAAERYHVKARTSVIDIEVEVEVEIPDPENPSKMVKVTRTELRPRLVIQAKEAKDGGTSPSGRKQTASAAA
jgi:hypothetical protein